ncbi:MAG: hypothetical protein HRU26_16725 [Psychroserpens sp.]|nr:hypothetical protein [Psychroserpens sp.]
MSEETRKRIEDDNRILKSEIKEFTEDLNSEDEFLNREAQQKLIDERKRTLEENKKILEEQVENVEKSSQEELDIREKLNDKLIANEKKKSDEIKNAQEQALRDLVSSAQFASQVFENISSSRIAQIDSEIDAISRREDQLRDAFNNAPQLAQKSLTELDNQRQELEDRRAEELERQARRELLVAGAQVFAQSGSIQEATNNLLELKGIVSNILVGFHDGGYTGKKGEYEIAGVTHGQEFVNTKKQVDEYDMHGWTASDFDAAVKSGHFQQFTDPKYLTYQPIPINNGSTSDNSVVVDRLEKVEKAIYSTIDYSPQHDLRWIEQNKEMEHIIKTKHKTDRLRRKSIRY